MIDLKPSIQRIEALVAQGTPASLTYAALECRLALERVCYDRLRQAHDYIAHEDLNGWSPGAIVKQLVADVDKNATATMTLSISTRPADDNIRPEDHDYVKLGTQVGLDAKKTARLWQALSNLALHSQQPIHRHDDLPDYGDPTAIAVKVSEALDELRRLSATTWITSGIGDETSFTCLCGQLNKRRAALLKDGQEVTCINAKCHWSWRVSVAGDEFEFQAMTIDTVCRDCGRKDGLPWRVLRSMKFQDEATWECASCGRANKVRLIFGQAN